MKLEIEYKLDGSLLQLLMLATGNSKKEVSSQLQDLTHPCFTLMDEEEKHTSWRKAPFPGTNVYLMIDVRRAGINTYPKPKIIKGEVKGDVKIKLWENNVSFSSKQVETYLIDKILLGAK